jgi:hypothetical protein
MYQTYWDEGGVFSSFPSSDLDDAMEVKARARSWGFDLLLVSQNSKEVLVVVTLLVSLKFLGARRHEIIGGRSIVAPIHQSRPFLDRYSCRIFLAHGLRILPWCMG